ncbi:MAG: glycoside hydrolase family 32 protein [Clostridiales bacterium]|nr:glycoside hydrolase family 32 protein [Clostridiales bacterium]
MKNDYRQKLHLEPRKGWLNDPNGLCFFNGAYHVYFQYAPESPLGKGGKCWGHFESPDLLNWTFTGTVLFPDCPDDRSGVYSGCGFVKNDTLYLFYTGNVKEEGDHDYITSGRGANVIMVTTKDGHNMSKKKTLLRNADYPDYCSCHVRDPKVWKEAGRYHMVLGARTLDSKGCVLYYVSDDLENWEYDKTVYGGDGSFMWECPDAFALGGNSYLSVSPQGIPPEKYRYQNVYSSGYFTMNGDVPGEYREWDIGFDFYAPQTFDAPDGRKIIIGWEGIGDIPYTNPTTDLGWQHCLTIPRELSAREDGAILQTPVREIEKLRKAKKTVKSGEKEKVSLPFEFTADINSDFELIFSNILKITYRGDELSLVFTDESAGCGRTERFAGLTECRNIRVIADMSSVEIFANNGETVMSSRMYPGDTDIVISASGSEGLLYQLDGMKITYNE